jgi:gliding motility-associated-like protein
MQLKPTTNFQRYTWSNGSAAASIQINTAGRYWLQVTDNNNCTGKDSITIYAKECMTGVYVPTAFTPNADARNDVFRAMAFGNIKTFEFIIYNRWGQTIFRTTDRFKGWDGKLAGMEQRSDVYIWTCRYQFEGEAEQIKRGTVTLIR